jgi:hypothetical protein
MAKFANQFQSDAFNERVLETGIVSDRRGSEIPRHLSAESRKGIEGKIDMQYLIDEFRYMSEIFAHPYRNQSNRAGTADNALLNAPSLSCHDGGAAN